MARQSPAPHHPGPMDHLFTWRHPKGIRLLTKTEVTKCMQEIVAQYSLPNVKGHSLHIGELYTTYS
ncbi:hypothetical protein ID866_3479 [Astraeus odoratus]|nr:hypothetical protein ID866_3479 [Astraeus odoratus]